MGAHERRFTDSEKKDIADIIYNEMVSTDGLEEEPIIVKTPIKSYLSDKTVFSLSYQ